MIPIGDSVPARNPPLTTWVLIIVNSVIFLFELTLSPPDLQHLFYLFGIVPARFTHPEWAVIAGFPLNDYWPFLTSMFLHGGWLHIIGNMWFLWLFGDNVEDRMGPLRFMVFYLLCGFAAGIVHCITSPDSTMPTVGASGAIAGVMGAYFFLFPFARVTVLFPIVIIPFFFQLPAVVYLGIWLLLQLFSGTLSLAHSGQVGGIAFWAHVGGFGTGMLLQFFFVRRGRAYRSPSRDEYTTDNAWLRRGYWRKA